jgi:D-glycero-beta-D-manno-heptose 1-phosphate adenylyltransferase
MPSTQAKTKILTEDDQLKQRVAEYRAAGQTIVLTQGSFDLVHIGHARYCAQAKQHGQILIVGVDSDVKVKKRKGDDRPIVPQDERMEMLTHLRSVDLVVLKRDDAPRWHYIKLIKPDVLIATKETYSASDLVDLQEFCGRVVVLEPQATTSTSAKIRLMQIGLAEKIAAELTHKLTATIDQAFRELKGQS